MFCLKVPTDPGWVTQAMNDLDAVLVDHAHCEMKAAANALSLAARHPGNARLALALTDLAREEIDHFQRVLRLLDARGIALGAPPVDAYAADLRRASNTLPRRSDYALVDRLIVGALIEARSCERFKLLRDGLLGMGDAHEGLARLYDELFAAEARHYRTFVDLAIEAAGGDADAVSSRLERLSDLEGAIILTLGQGQGPGGGVDASARPRAAVHG